MLKGVSLVTGGASGLGKATVEMIINHGGKAIICDLPTSNGANVAKKFGPNVRFFPGDVRSEADIKNCLNEIKTKFGRLDVVINCAAIPVVKTTYSFKKNAPCELDVFNKVIAVNTMGTWNVIRLAVGLMIQNQPDIDGSRGVIINNSSTIAFDGHAGLAQYAASKAAIVGMTLPLAREFAPKGIRVCTIVPGYFDTPVHSFTKEARAFYENHVPHPKRFGKPHEYAILVKGIINNPYLNGECIRLDGALRMEA